MQKYKRWEPPGLIQNKIAKNILLGLGITAGVALFLASPTGLFFLVKGTINYSLRKRDFNREIKRLKKKEYVALTKTPAGWLVRLTKKGEKRLQKSQVQELTLKPTKNWDRKWRLFIFDIPEKQRSGRDLVRKKIKELGLYNIQRSVFVYPYDCRRELDLLVDYYNLGKYTTYAEINKIDIDRELRKHFRTII
ncbi:hypothetical protein D4R52_02225 [bacterium]|nr:MAG: hypothetical protein D4R52_02225 [bacterium]